MNIWIAASEGNTERVRELIAEGTSPDAKDENSYTPLHAAASWGHEDILRLLVEKGADVNIVDEDGETALFVVEQPRIAEVLLELGIDAGRRNSDGETAAWKLASEYEEVAEVIRRHTGEAERPPGEDDAAEELVTRVNAVLERRAVEDISQEDAEAQLESIVRECVERQVDIGRYLADEGVGDSVLGARPSDEGDSANGVKRQR